MKLSVTTPAGSLLDTDVEEISAPGLLGEFGILPGHIPFMSALRPGVFTYRTKEGTRAVAIDQGILQVAPIDRGEQVLVLVDRALPAKNIDRDAAAKEAADLDVQLNNWKGDLGAEHQVLVARRDWAQARVDTSARAGAH
jgi:F-type H+-transporting ATPase subunit epsilon